MGRRHPVDLADRIRTGDVAIDFYRPVGILGWYLAADVGRAGYHLLTRGLVPTVVGALLFDLRYPSGPVAAASFALSVVLALMVSFAIRFLVALSAFWILDDQGTNVLASAAAYFFSGLTVPLVLFPGGGATSCGRCRGRRSCRRRPTCGSARTPAWRRSACGPAGAVGRRAAGLRAGCCAWPSAAWWCRVATPVASAGRGLDRLLAISQLWVRASMAYPVSFWMLAVGRFLSPASTSSASWILFHTVDYLGGFSLTEVGFLYGGTGLGIAFGDLVVGRVERLGQMIRLGRLDQMMVQPVPLLVQVCADEFALRRFARVLQASMVFGWAC